MKKIKKIFAIIGTILILATMFVIPCSAIGVSFGEDAYGFTYSNFILFYSPEDYTYEFDEETDSALYTFKSPNPEPCLIVLEYKTPSAGTNYKQKYFFTERFSELYLDLNKAGYEVYDELKHVFFLAFYTPFSLENLEYPMELMIPLTNTDDFISSYDEQFGWANEYAQEYALEQAVPLNEQITSLNSQIADKNTEISKLENDVTALEGTITEKDNEISTLEDTIIQNEIDYSALEEAKATSESNLNTEISALSNKNLELTATVNSLEKQMQLKINKAYASGLTDSETSFNIAPIAIGVSILGILVTIVGLVINRKRRSNKRG
ncbi:MAG: hypothetical protein IJ437_04470 [Clostridia bacterium]|nr:hypothetical protein [Clostridia bacterium]